MHDHHDIDATRIAEIVRHEGIYVLPEFLSPDEVAAIAAEGRRLHSERPPFVRHHDSVKGDSFVINMVPSRLVKHDGWCWVPTYRQVLSNPIVKEVADRYLGANWGTSNFIYHYVQAGADEELFPLHFDNPDLRKCLKVYVFLTPCTRENAAFRYIPGSHRVVRRVLDAAAAGRIDAAVLGYNRLEHLLDLIEGNADLFDEPDLRARCDLLRALQREPERAYDYLVSGGPGTIVLFDTTGIHGGGKLHSGERYISRYHLVDASYVFKHHPEQLPPVARVISKAWRFSRLARAKISRSSA